MSNRIKFYQCIKQVHAEPMTFGHFTTSIKKMRDVGSMDPTANGYHVIYNQGTGDEYHSWSPKAVFEEGYLEIPPGTSKAGSQARAKLS